jgi:2-oxoglutarate ferredoxin oxidoreductase subunit delta
MTAKRQKKTKSDKATKKQKTTPAKDAVKEKEPKEKFEVEFYRDWCKGCGICVAFCPAGALSLNDIGEPEISKPELCTGCTWCEIRCPDFSVQVKEKEEAKGSEA